MTNTFRMMVLFANYDQNWNPIILKDDEMLKHVMEMQAAFPEIVEECSQNDYLVRFYLHQAFDENGKEILKTINTSAAVLSNHKNYNRVEIDPNLPEELKTSGKKLKEKSFVFRLKQNADADCLAAALFFASSESIEFIVNGFETDELEELAKTLPLANKKAKPVFTIGYDSKSCASCFATKTESVCEQTALVNFDMIKPETATILLAGILASGKTSNTSLIMDLINKGADENRAKEYFK